MNFLVNILESYVNSYPHVTYGKGTAYTSGAVARERSADRKPTEEPWYNIKSIADKSRELKSFTDVTGKCRTEVVADQAGNTDRATKKNHG